MLTSSRASGNPQKTGPGKVRSHQNGQFTISLWKENTVVLALAAKCRIWILPASFHALSPLSRDRLSEKNLCRKKTECFQKMKSVKTSKNKNAGKDPLFRHAFATCLPAANPKAELASLFRFFGQRKSGFCPGPHPTFQIIHVAEAQFCQCPGRNGTHMPSPAIHHNLLFSIGG